MLKRQIRPRDRMGRIREATSENELERHLSNSVKNSVKSVSEKIGLIFEGNSSKAVADKK